MEGVKLDRVVKRLNAKYSSSSPEYKSQYFVGVASWL